LLTHHLDWKVVWVYHEPINLYHIFDIVLKAGVVVDSHQVAVLAAALGGTKNHAGGCTTRVFLYKSLKRHLY